MSLRVRVELVLFIVFGLVIGLSYGIQRLVILPGLDPVERKTAQKDMERSSEAIERQAGIVKRRAAEWSREIEDRISRGDSSTVIPEDELAAAGVSAAFWFKPMGERNWDYTAPVSSGQPRKFAEFSAGIKPEHAFLMDAVNTGCVLRPIKAPRSTLVLPETTPSRFSYP